MCKNAILRIIKNKIKEILILLSTIDEPDDDISDKTVRTLKVIDNSGKERTYKQY